MGWTSKQPLAATLLVVCVGCAGNGEGLDQNGQPLGDGSVPQGPVTADFQSIQDNVFTPICAKCHIGASAPEGLQLDAAHSYNLLVGVASNEKPSLLRVSAGDADSSYMLQKIEGAPGIVGGQMPLGQTPLPQATIQAIRQWISNGAANSPSAAASASFDVQTSAPANLAVMNTPVARVLVTFTQAVDASMVDDIMVSVQRRELDDADSHATEVPMSISLAERNPAVLTMTPQAALAPGEYRVTLRGTGARGLRSVSGMSLGSDRRFEFTVEPAP
jgi:Bacterial Ig-like domain